MVTVREVSLSLILLYHGQYHFVLEVCLGQYVEVWNLNSEEKNKAVVIRTKARCSDVLLSLDEDMMGMSNIN